MPFPCLWLLLQLTEATLFKSLSFVPSLAVCQGRLSVNKTLVKEYQIYFKEYKIFQIVATSVVTTGVLAVKNSH